ncbi:MAG TPA: DNA alkylation repair protein [Bryobacteraceae bacterium]|jgi:3-methyladenine DNA glycosylase AlkD
MAVPALSDVEEVLAALRALGKPGNLAGMARFAIRTEHAFGVGTPALRALSKRLGRDHARALRLWDTGVREARLLAAMTADPSAMTRRQMERWARDLDSWDVCDGCCLDLFRKTPFAWEKALAWSARKPEFVKRAGFALMATLAVHDKAAPHRKFLALLPVIERESTDERNFVKKAVNWALRQIGKRDPRLRGAALRTSARLRKSESRSARWIGSDALRELRLP